eukprot:3461479-Amphidinium_carterae.1
MVNVSQRSGENAKGPPPGLHAGGGARQQNENDTKYVHEKHYEDDMPQPTNTLFSGWSFDSFS